MIRVLIVDDERLARAELRRLLAEHPQVEVVGEAENADKALQAIKALRPDLALLDIQMPGMDGIRLAGEICDQTQFIFCTAYDSFAIDAFGLNALDYLLKPVAPERLSKALQRVQLASQQVNHLPMDHGVLLKFGESARVVRLHEIDRFHAVGNHAQVFTPYGKSFVLSSLTRIEQRLDPGYFFRTSRSDIVRLGAIVSFEPDVGSALVARLVDNSEVGVSRRQSQLLKARMGTI